MGLRHDTSRFLHSCPSRFPFCCRLKACSLPFVLLFFLNRVPVNPSLTHFGLRLRHRCICRGRCKFKLQSSLLISISLIACAVQHTVSILSLIFLPLPFRTPNARWTLLFSTSRLFLVSICVLIRIFLKSFSIAKGPVSPLIPFAPAPTNP